MNRAFRKRVQRLLAERPPSSQGADEIQTAALEISNRYRQRTLELLAEVTAETAPQVARELGQALIKGTTEGVAAAARLLPFPEKLECAPGCAWCCHEPLQVSILDAVNVAQDRAPCEYSLETRDGASLKGIFTPCPFLGEDHRCTVYAQRPTVCRAFQSTSASRCKSSYERRDPNRGVPMHMGLFGFAGLALDGMNEAFDAVGIDRSPVVLGLAVARLAEDFDGRARAWLSGQPAFTDVAVVEPRVRQMSLNLPIANR